MVCVWNACGIWGVTVCVCGHGVCVLDGKMVLDVWLFGGVTGG